MDGVVDDNEAKFVDDGTGLHPTPTTYERSLVAESTAIDDEVYVAPKAETYHIPSTDEEIDTYNTILATDLEFNGEKLAWANYRPHEFQYEGRTAFTNGQPFTNIWVEGFQPAFSWDFNSTLTGQSYANICPSVLFCVTQNGVTRTAYYFFEVIFNDYQAIYGYDNWNVKLDGWPSTKWPGVIMASHDTQAANQTPPGRGTYEDWFKTTYGQLSYAAPMVVGTSKMSSTSCPRRYRKIDSSGRTRKDEFPDQELSESFPSQLDTLPSFNTNIAVRLGGPDAFVTTNSTTGLDYNKVWKKAFTNVWTSNFTGNAGSVSTLAIAQKSSTVPSSVALYEGTPSPAYYGLLPIQWEVLSDKIVYSGWLTSGSGTQCVGWVLYNGGGSGGGILVTTGYGYTSLSPLASKAGSSKYQLKSPSTQEEILGQMRFGSGSYCLGFIFDASVGAYGEVTWISQV